jgi:hypothetical protein
MPDMSCLNIRDSLALFGLGIDVNHQTPLSYYILAPDNVIKTVINK